MWTTEVSERHDQGSKKQGGLLSRSVMLQHDNAPVRKAKKVQGAVIGADIHRAMVATAQKRTHRAPPCEELDPATFFSLFH